MLIQLNLATKQNSSRPENWLHVLLHVFQIHTTGSGTIYKNSITAPLYESKKKVNNSLCRFFK